MSNKNFKDLATKVYFDHVRNLIVYDKDWQYPARTECAAYESIVKYLAKDENSIYVAFPWATLIDGLRNNKKNIELLLIELNFISRFLRTSNHKNVFTVCQHIHMKEFMPYFKMLGITHIFWSHKLRSDNVLEGIQLRAFPLFPAQTYKDYVNFLYLDEDVYLNSLRNRKFRYLANFIGAYNPDIYLSDVRKQIFDDKDLAGFHIIARKEWHFERAVYAKQISGKNDDVSKLLQEEAHTAEYLNAIFESSFTLCPTGSGPNSIRIYESLCLGSIPVILTNELDLAGSHELWEKACIIVDDTTEGYVAAKQQMTNMSEKEVLEKRMAGVQLLRMVGPDNYFDLIFNIVK